MTSARSIAYRRVAQTLRDLGPAKLWPDEEALVREAADALLFCQDFATDRVAREAVADSASLMDHLIECGRWTDERALRLLDDLWACGPASGKVLAA